MEFVVAILLFTGGIFLGSLCPGSTFLEGCLGTISSLATIAAAVAAMYALNSWKAQFTNTKRHDALNELHAALFGLDVYRAYALCFRDFYAEAKAAPQGEKVKALDEYRKGLEIDLQTAFHRYNSAWNNARVFLGDALVESDFSVETVRAKIVKEVVGLHACYEELCGNNIDADRARALEVKINFTCSGLGISLAEITKKGDIVLRQEIRKTIN